MWNWLVSALAEGATIVLFDGSPSHPTLDVLWDAVDRLEVTHFGTSARFIHGCRAAGPRAARTASASTALRTVFSTGSPLARTGFEWVYRDVKADVHLASISGGTDIVGCFMLGVPTEPVYAGEIQAPGARRRPRGVRRGRPAGRRPARRAGVPAAAAVDAAALLGRRRRRALSRRLLRALSRRLAARRSHRDHAARAASSSTAAATPRSTPAACASAPPRSTGPSKPCRRSSRGSPSASAKATTR